MAVSDHHLEVAPDVANVRNARRFVSERLALLDAWGAVEVAALLTSELVTNAIVHAKSSVCVRVVVHTNTIRVTVEDESEAHPQHTIASNSAVTGRGLTLVDRLARRWGVEVLHGGRGKAVWFELSP